jgi:hypothetical protein
MSLDVYLMSGVKPHKCICQCGNEHEIEESIELFWANITHNLGTMADKAGIYEYLWRPEEINCTVAKDLIDPLTIGLEKLKSDPDFFKQFNDKNGWGTYNVFVPWIQEYLDACIEYPDALIGVSR